MTSLKKISKCIVKKLSKSVGRQISDTDSSKLNDNDEINGSRNELTSRPIPMEMNKVDQIPLSKTEQKPGTSSSKSNHRQNSSINTYPTSDIKFDSLDISLLEVCKQKHLISVKHITDDKNISGIKYLAGGSYGKVFIAKHINHDHIIFKESMIGSRLSDGSVIRNHQNSDFILSDLINSQRLSQLNSDPKSFNYCSNFAHVLDNYYVYHHDRNVTTKRKEYIICKQTFGGKPLNNSDIFTPKVGLSIMSQILASIAVAEQQLKFEHRDLHQNNILIDKTNEKYGYYRLKGNSFKIKLNGTKVTLIDNTFSRTEINNQVVFNDLTRLFAPDAGECEDKELENCYQKMNEITGGQWNRFCPKTNIVWLQLIFSRIRIEEDRKQYCGLRFHRSESDTINSLKQNIGKYNSVLDLVENRSMFYNKTKAKPNKSKAKRILKNINIFQRFFSLRNKFHNLFLL